MFLAFLLSFLGASVCKADELNLEFVTFVHRHGDRFPIYTYPTDPYKNVSLWNNSWGELTNGGKQNAYELGKWLRQRYVGFLPEIYNGNDYGVQSTDTSRTLMSAYLVLAGLYAPKGSDVWNPDIKWQPIPVHTTPRVLDNVLAAGKPCPKHMKLYIQLLMSKEVAAQLEPYEDALSEVAGHAGYPVFSRAVFNLITTMPVFDTLFVQRHNGYSLPSWAEPYVPQPLENLTSMYMRLGTYNPPMRRLHCGLLVKDILENFKAKARGTLTKKMWQYSAHDITIIGLKQCLNLNELDTPPFASALILELRSSKGQYFVKILYKREAELKSLVMPGCTELCPLEKFEELVTPIIPEDWEAECQG